MNLGNHQLETEIGKFTLRDSLPLLTEMTSLITYKQEYNYIRSVETLTSTECLSKEGKICCTKRSWNTSEDSQCRSLQCTQSVKGADGTSL